MVSQVAGAGQLVGQSPSQTSPGSSVPLPQLSMSMHWPAPGSQAWPAPQLPQLPPQPSGPHARPVQSAVQAAGDTLGAQGEVVDDERAPLRHELH